MGTAGRVADASQTRLSGASPLELEFGVARRDLEKLPIGEQRPVQAAPILVGKLQDERNVLGLVSRELLSIGVPKLRKFRRLNKPHRPIRVLVEDRPFAMIQAMQIEDVPYGAARLLVIQISISLIPRETKWIICRDTGRLRFRNYRPVLPFEEDSQGVFGQRPTNALQVLIVAWGIVFRLPMFDKRLLIFEVEMEGEVHQSTRLSWDAWGRSSIQRCLIYEPAI